MILLLLINLFYQTCLAEIPLTVCSNDRPFKTKEHTCANFNEICVKNGDLECDNFQTACKQCPPTNYTVLMFFDIVRIKEQLLQQVEKIKILSNVSDITERKSEKLMEHTIKNSSLLIAITIVCIVSLSVMLTMAIIISLFYKKKTSIEEYSPISTNEDTVQMNELQSVQPSGSNDSCIRIKFEFLWLKAILEGNICKLSTILEIKLKIISVIRLHSFQILQLIYKGVILDDNECLWRVIDEKHSTMCLAIQNSVDSSDMIIYLKSNFKVPSMIKINKSRRVLDIRNIINKYLASITSKNFEFSIIKDNEELENESKLGDTSIKDKDCIRVLERRKETLNMRSIFEDKDTLAIEYSNMDQVSIIAKRAAFKFNCDPDYFLLFLNKQCLEEDKYIYEYDIKEDSPIKFYCLLRFRNLKIENIPLDENHNHFLYKGSMTSEDSNKQDILIMKYKLSIPQLKERLFFCKQLIFLEITKQNERFVHLFGIYNDEEFFYEAMEYMSKGSLPMFLENNKDITEKQVAKWTFQIMEGLKHLHKNNILYEDLTPYDIMIDENQNVKLLSLCLYKYLKKDINSDDDIKEVFGSQNSTLMVYIAPENRKIETSNTESDVWSLGVILIYVMNRSHPNIKIKEGQPIKYDLPNNVSKELEDFIDSCVKFDPDKRFTIDQLMNHEFIQKNYKY